MAQPAKMPCPSDYLESLEDALQNQSCIESGTYIYESRDADDGSNEYVPTGVKETWATIVDGNTGTIVVRRDASKATPKMASKIDLTCTIDLDGVLPQASPRDRIRSALREAGTIRSFTVQYSGLGLDTTNSGGSARFVFGSNTDFAKSRQGDHHARADRHGDFVRIWRSMPEPFGEPLVTWELMPLAPNTIVLPLMRIFTGACIKRLQHQANGRATVFLPDIRDVSSPSLFSPLFDARTTECTDARVSKILAAAGREYSVREYEFRGGTAYVHGSRWLLASGDSDLAIQYTCTIEGTEWRTRLAEHHFCSP